MPKPPPKKPHVSPEDFIRAWQEGESTDAVAKFLGLTNCNARAAAYRKRGIPLKKMPYSRISKIDIEALADLARSLAPPAVKSVPSPAAQQLAARRR